MQTHRGEDGQNAKVSLIKKPSCLFKGGLPFLLGERKKAIMKNMLVILFLLLSSNSVWCGEFEDTKKAAEQGQAEAQNYLGLKYELGSGVPQNP
jgi:hypothetical protein